MADTLPPAGFELRLDPSLRRLDRGRILVGGTPLRIVKLTDAGADAVDSWEQHDPLDDSESHRRLARRLLDAGMVHPKVASTIAGDVTVIIPVHDNPAGLDRCLGALGNVGILVVDDASGDAVSHRRITKAHGAAYIRREINGGPGAARSTGLKVIDTEFVAFVDSDVEVRPGWLSSLLGHFADPLVVAVSPRVRSRLGSGYLASYERQHSPLDLGDVAGPVGPGRRVSYVPTAAMLARTASVISVGGFDPDMRWGEDVDLIWKLVDSGGVVRYDPAVEVLHEPRSRWLPWLSQRFRYGSSAAALGRRHAGNVAPARCSRWSAAAWLIAVAGHPVVGAGVAVGSTAALAQRLDSLPHPGAEAVRLASRGHLLAGLGLARAASRVWWPLVAVVAIRHPRRRPAAAAVVLAPAVIDWVRGSRPAGFVRSVALHTVDDMAYGVGVWKGVIAERTLAPILPSFAEWPGRRDAVGDTTVARE